MGFLVVALGIFLCFVLFCLCLFGLGWVFLFILGLGFCFLLILGKKYEKVHSSKIN